MKEVDSRRFVRIEGFFDDKERADIEQTLGNLATNSFDLEEHVLRDRDEQGRLLTNTPGIGLVTTKLDIVHFANRLPFQNAGRAETLFRALHSHYRNSHENPENFPCCDCSLRCGTLITPGYRSTRRMQHINPVSLVTAYVNKELDNIPSQNLALARSEPRPLKDAACYELLPLYVKAISE